MKKLIMFAVLGIMLLPSSWQIYNSSTKLFTVHYGKTAKSPICFQGKVEDYNGACTSPKVTNPEYEAKQQAIRQGTWNK